MRLDLYLTENGFFQSRARAQEAIAAGKVRVNGAIASKASRKISNDDVLNVAGDVHGYVSRGGMKLAAALRSFEIDPAGKACLDLGASTGGFTDVLLGAGAAKIYAVDVGHGQLHEKIAADPRVVNLERTHAKDLSPELIPEPVEIIVCDISFISLKKTLPFALPLAAPGAELIALVKPQFEVGRARIGKGGIVKPGDQNTFGVAEDMAQWISEQESWTSKGYMESPIKGGGGNREFLLGAVKRR